MLNQRSGINFPIFELAQPIPVPRYNYSESHEVDAGTA